MNRILSVTAAAALLLVGCESPAKAPAEAAIKAAEAAVEAAKAEAQQFVPEQLEAAQDAIAAAKAKFTAKEYPAALAAAHGLGPGSRRDLDGHDKRFDSQKRSW